MKLNLKTKLKMVEFNSIIIIFIRHICQQKKHLQDTPDDCKLRDCSASKFSSFSRNLPFRMRDSTVANDRPWINPFTGIMLLFNYGNNVQYAYVRTVHLSTFHCLHPSGGTKRVSYIEHTTISVIQWF